MDDINVIGPATLSVTQTVAVFFSFLPSLKEVRKATAGDDTARDVHAGIIAASVVALTIGTIITSLTKNPMPIYVCALIVACLVVVYEVTLRSKPS